MRATAQLASLRGRSERVVVYILMSNNEMFFEDKDLILRTNKGGEASPLRRKFSDEANRKERLIKGFTVVEALMTIFILGLVGLAIWTFQKDLFSLNRILQSDLAAQKEARQAFKGMTAEIRSASPSSLGSYPLLEVDASSFIFYSEIDDDGLKERIRYFLDGTVLKKGVLKPSGNPLTYNPTNEIISEVVHDIANDATPIFDYYDTNYDGTTASLAAPVNVLAVRLVKINIIIDHDPLRSPGPITLTTQVSIRNLKDNL